MGEGMPRKAADVTLYADRIKRVIAYIQDNLDRDVSVDRLSEVACMSPFHWHRVYRKFQGETLAETVRRLRLHRASYYLAFSDLPVKSIAKICGYEHHQSFGWAFFGAYRQTPSQFRASQATAPRTLGVDRELLHVSVENTTTERAFAVEHRGDVLWVGRSLTDLYLRVTAQNKHCADAGRYYAVYEQPSPSAPQAHGKVWAAMTCEGAVMQGSSHAVTPVILPGGCVARINYRGPYAGLSVVHEWFHEVWLPSSGYKLGPDATVEEYKNDPLTAAANELETSIRWPLLPCGNEHRVILGEGTHETKLQH